MATPSPRGLWRWLLAPVVLLLVLAALRPLSVPDEGRYAEISRWMLVSGDWLVPRLNGLPFFHKPPLTHWGQAASMAVFGATALAGFAVNEAVFVLLLRAFGWPSWLALVLALIVAAGQTFVLGRFWAFRR